MTKLLFLPTLSLLLQGAVRCVMLHHNEPADPLIQFLGQARSGFSGRGGRSRTSPSNLPARDVAYVNARATPLISAAKSRARSKRRTRVGK